jgi:hypothetical protein
MHSTWDTSPNEKTAPDDLLYGPPPNRKSVGQVLVSAPPFTRSRVSHDAIIDARRLVDRLRGICLPAE